MVEKRYRDCWRTKINILNFYLLEGNFISKSRMGSTGKDLFIQQGLDDQHV